MRLSSLFMGSFLLFCIAAISTSAVAQSASWQQRVTYDMDVRLDVETHQMDGKQTLTYFNNSPDTLHRLYYHLFFNAFQPNSMMDVRSRTISDPDGRVRDRIYHLDEHEIGYQKVLSLQQNGADVTFEVHETVLVVHLNEPILPGSQTVMDMTFESQVPVQIRRSGRDSREGIAYSMSQWYPRIAAYDQDGWATSPYVGREFHGTFGDFDVRITIDSTYTIGGTGYLQNPQEIGKGYETPGTRVNRPNTRELTWHFIAPDVIDFMWGAHDQFTHEIHQVPNGPRIHLLYVKNDATRNWSQLGDYTVQAFEFLNEYLGPYPYEQFTVIQGGDGGMEYPMATLITGHRNLRSLVGVTVHELLHMWFQSVLATNESRHHWMDEGLTVYMSNITMAHLFNELGLPLYGNYISYLRVVNDEIEEPMNTHADRFNTNRAYSIASYTKGAMLAHQLGYVIGEDALKRTFRRYYEEWQFRHPTPTDFRIIAEKESGLILDWYFDQWLFTTHTIDYNIDKVSHKEYPLEIRLRRDGVAIMPLDILVAYDDGSREVLYVPQHLMLGKKPHESLYYGNIPRIELEPWRWTDETYHITLDRPGRKVKEVIIDPTFRLADVNRLNNTWPSPREVIFAQPLTESWDKYTITYRPSLWYGEVAGIRAGLAAQGSYLFGNNRTEGRFMLTSGSLDDFATSEVDVDYFFSYERRLQHFGKSAFVELSARRYYGIGEENLTFRKYIGDLGMRESVTRLFTFRLFQQHVERDRNIAILQSEWDDRPVVGMHLKYTMGDMARSGMDWNFVTGSQDRFNSASYGSVTATHTSYLGFNTNLRYTVSAGTGSELMPTQWRWALSGPTGEQLWRNHAYWGIANIDSDFTRDSNLLANDGTGLIGYGLPGVNSPDIAGNNYFSGTLWFTNQPFAASQIFKNLSLELFAGAGKSWNGHLVDDFPDFNEFNPLLASVGTGLVFDVGALPVFDRWRPQSRFLQELQLIVRMPFYLHGLQGQDEFGARFVIGVSERF